MRWVAGLGVVGLGIALAHGEEPARIRGLDDVQSLCASIEPDMLGREQALARVYAVAFPARGFALAPYDTRRARVVVDAARGLRGDGGRFELVLHDLAGKVSVKEPFDIAVPASAEEAAALAAAHARGELGLTVLFQVATAGGAACAPVLRVTGEGIRVAIEPLAFTLTRAGEPIASGESPRMVALRERMTPSAVVAPRVVVAAPMRTSVNGRAPARVARAARGLAPQLMKCYRVGLAQQPTLRGPFVAGVEVGRNGHVTAAHAELDGLGIPEVTSCVLRVVRAARFPGGRQRLSIPVRFTE